MRAHHLNTGTLCPMSARLVHGTGDWLARARLVCHVLLLETGDGLTIVEKGLGTAHNPDTARLGRAWLRQVAPKLRPEETALAQVRALGFSPRDVRHIVLTHLDLDHAGGIADFPEATVHVHVREHRAATQREGNRAGMRYIEGHLRHAPRWSLFDDGGERWFDLEGVRALDERRSDVLLVPLPGHTTGHTGVAVRTDRGWLLHAGDAYFFHGQVETPPHAPFVLRMFQRRSDMDRAARTANQERIRALVAQHGAEVTPFCAHDPVDLARLQAAAIQLTASPARGPSPSTAGASS